MGIEQATARIQEIRALVHGNEPVPAAPGAGKAGFAAALDSSMLAGGDAMPAGAAGNPMAAQLAAAGLPMPAQLAAGGMPSSQALAIQGMLPTSVPSPATAPRASMLTGDVAGLEPELKNALEQVATKLGKKLHVESGRRTHAEQAALYQSYLAGTGNLAAPPGSSRHETGRAADVNVDGVGLGSVPGGREAARAAGLGFPVAGEDWHAELV